MYAFALTAALLAPQAAPPADATSAAIAVILPTPDDTLKAIGKAVDDALEGSDVQLPKGWKDEYLRLWKTKGMARARRALSAHLRENFSLRELRALGTREGEETGLSERERRVLGRKVERFQEFARKVGQEVGSELGEEAQLNLTRYSY